MYWKIKLAAKVLSGRIPLLKTLFQGLGYFRHGNMASGNYAVGVFNRHFSQYARFNRLATPKVAETPDGKEYLPRRGGRGACLEIGPGESLLTMISAHASGFDRTVLLDQGSQIRQDPGVYITFSRFLRRHGYEVPEVEENGILETLLRAFTCEYLIEGIRSLAGLKSDSIDFSFSHAVLEHLPREQVPEYLRHLKRVIKSSGVSSHVVDLRDHLGGSLNHLRFSREWWESEAVRASGVYTNRLRYSEWLREFENAGLDFRIEERQCFPAIPLDRKLLSPEFRDLPEVDLITHGFHVVFSKESRMGS